MAPTQTESVASRKLRYPTAFLPLEYTQYCVGTDGTTSQHANIVERLYDTLSRTRTRLGMCCVSSWARARLWASIQYTYSGPTFPPSDFQARTPFSCENRSSHSRYSLMHTTFILLGYQVVW